MARVFGDAGVGRDLRVGTSVRAAMPVTVVVAEGTRSEQIRLSGFLERMSPMRRRDIGRLGACGRCALDDPRTVSRKTR